MSKALSHNLLIYNNIDNNALLFVVCLFFKYMSPTYKDMQLKSYTCPSDNMPLRIQTLAGYKWSDLKDFHLDLSAKASMVAF